jgi:hypothetical protein
MNRSRVVASALLLFSAVLVACAPPRPTIRADYDRSVDLSSYRTYGFMSPLGTDKAGYSTLITSHFKDAIRREMDARGYQYTETNPDLFVNFNVNVQEKVDVRSTPSASMGVGYYGYRGGMYGTYPMYSGTDVDTIRYKQGTANVDLVDAAQKRLVWEGIAEGKLQKKAMEDPQTAISKVIAEMFAKFPVGAAPAS